MQQYEGTSVQEVLDTLRTSNPVHIQAPIIYRDRPHLRADVGGHKAHIKLAVRHTCGPFAVTVECAEILARNEAAAFLVADDLGLSGMVPPTVYRRVPYNGTTPWAAVSLDMEEPPAEKLGGRWTDVPTEDILDGAVFDYLVDHTDRHGGNIFLDPRVGGFRMLLPDNEHTFGVIPPRGRLTSHVIRQRTALGLDLTPRLKDAAAFIAADPNPEMVKLIPPKELARLRERISALV